MTLGSLNLQHLVSLDVLQGSGLASLNSRIVKREVDDVKTIVHILQSVDVLQSSPSASSTTRIRIRICSHSLWSLLHVRSHLQMFQDRAAAGPTSWKRN